MKMNCFNSLPPEIIETILYYLPSNDQINLCLAINGKNYLQQKRISQKINLARCYHYSKTCVRVLIKRYYNLAYIKVLNINQVYWTNAVNIRNLVQLSTNLEELHAVDTKIGFKNEDLTLYANMPKLTSISITVNLEETESNCPEIESIKSLKLKIIGESFRKFLELAKCFKKFKNLINLTIENRLKQYMPFNLWMEDVYKIKMYSMNYKENHFGFFLDENLVRSEYFRSSYDITPSQIQLKNTINHFSSDLKELLSKWIQINYRSVPYSLGDFWDSILYPSKPFYFKELNFAHKGDCGNEITNLIEEILNTKYAQNLKKLGLCCCFFYGCADTKFEKGPIYGFKRKRQGLQVIPSSHIRRLFEKLIDLEELEVFTDESVGTSQLFCGFEEIAILTRLKSINIQTPPQIDGNFLDRILQNCKRLESLSIRSIFVNMKINLELYKSIHLGSSLKTFKLVNEQIDLDMLFKSLENIENCQLQRVYIENSSGKDFLIQNLVKFINKNPQLIFLAIILENNTISFCKRANNVLKQYKKHVSQLFAVDTKAEKVYKKSPAAHLDLFNCYSRIASTVVE